MTEEEIRKLYTRLAFQYEFAIDVLLAKGLIDEPCCCCEKEVGFGNFIQNTTRPALRSLRRISRISFSSASVLLWMAVRTPGLAR